MFIYLLIPLKHNFKPIILHLQSAPSGTANETIIHNNVEQLSHTKFNVKYCSCDGDSYYNKFFHNQFEHILKTKLSYGFQIHYIFLRMVDQEFSIIKLFLIQKYLEITLIILN